MNQILMASDYPYVNIRTDDRLEYYRVLDEASKVFFFLKKWIRKKIQGDILEFERFLMCRMQKTLDLYVAALDQPVKKSTPKITENYETEQVDTFRASVIELWIYSFK